MSSTFSWARVGRLSAICRQALPSLCCMVNCSQVCTSSVAEGHGLQQLVQRHALLLVHRPAVSLVTLAHAHGIDDDKVVLHHMLAGVHLLQVRGVADAHAPALHLLEEAATLHAAHEHDDL